VRPDALGSGVAVDAGEEDGVEDGVGDGMALDEGEDVVAGPTHAATKNIAATTVRKERVIGAS
jgi:hypothetical protein